MKLSTACVNIVDVSRHFLWFPIISLLLTHCLSSSDDSHFEMKQSKLWWSKRALGFLNDRKGIFIFLFFSDVSLYHQKEPWPVCLHIPCIMSLLRTFSVADGWGPQTDMICALVKASVDHNTKSQIGRKIRRK